MSDTELLDQILKTFVVVTAMAEVIGKDEVEKHLRWAAKNYAERIYKQSYADN